MLLTNYGANTPYDPTQAGGAPAAGNQPVGWDTWTSLYGRYTPVSSKISIRLADMSSDVGSVEFCIALTDSSTLKGITEISQLVGEPIKKSKRKMFGNPERYTANFNGASLTYSAKTFWNVSDLFINGASTQNAAGQVADVDSDIAVNYKAYYHFCLQAVNPAVDITAINGIVRIDYMVLFYQSPEHEDAAES